MKRIVSLLILFVVTFNLNAQKSPNRYIRRPKNYFNVGSPDDKFKIDYNQFSSGIYYGFHGSLSSASINSIQSHAIQINTRLFIRPSFGLNFKVGFDQFNIKENQLRKSNYADLYVDVFYDLIKLLEMQEVIEKVKNKDTNFKLLFHAGSGISSMWNDDFTSPNATDPYFKNHDDMLNLNFGMSPEFRLSNHFSIGFDFSVKFNFLQNRSFNYAFENSSQQAKMYALMVGLNYFY
jgi:hypothetical protein